jgi:hypothetical protein
MFSTNLKRSVATLGVVAGLLAAAVPASAGEKGVPGDIPNDALTVKAPTNAGSISGKEMTDAILSVKAPGPSEISALSIATSEVFELNTMGGNDTLKVDSDVTDYLADAGTGDDKVWNNGDDNDLAKAEGTQVGSEGVMNGNDGDDTLILVADAGSGDDNLRGEAIDIIP